MKLEKNQRELFLSCKICLLDEEEIENEGDWDCWIPDWRVGERDRTELAGWEGAGTARDITRALR